MACVSQEFFGILRRKFLSVDMVYMVDFHCEKWKIIDVYSFLYKRNK